MSRSDSGSGLRSGWVGALTGALLLGVASGCSNLKDLQLATVGVDYWQPSISGEIQSTQLNMIGTQLDLEDDLDLDDEDVFVFRGLVSMGGSKLAVKYFDLEYSGDRLLDSDVVFSGVNYSAGELLASDLQVRYGTAQLVTSPFNLQSVQLGLTAGIDYLLLDTELGSDATAPTSQEEEEFFPSLGAVARFDYPLGEEYSFFLEAEGSGLFFDFRDVDGTVLDASARAGLGLATWLAMGVGYRIFDTNVEIDDNDYDFKIDGIFFFGDISF